MRVFLFICSLLVAATCFATGPEYSSSRRWIEEHTAKSKTPKAPRVFVGDFKSTTRTYILRYHKGMALRDIIDSTHLKSTTVMVTVLRNERKTQTVFDDLVKGSDKPKFQVRAEDLIWLATLPVVRN